MTEMSTEIRLVGEPDGPEQFVASLGVSVGTFTTPAGGKLPALNHHVPLMFRGNYKPEELADFKPRYPYRIDPFGKALCTGMKKDGNECRLQATNRSGLCEMHGGRVHPLDKIAKDVATQEDTSTSRYKLYLAGQLTIEDLTDEEIAACGFLGANGKTIYKPRSVPRELAQAFSREQFRRARDELSSHTLGAARTTAEIMLNKNVEADIRLKAANMILDRNLGKAPQTIQVTASSGWEEIFEDLVSGSRDNSRKARGIDVESERQAEIERNTIDAEVVEPEQDSADGEVRSPDDERPRVRKKSNGDGIDNSEGDGSSASNQRAHAGRGTDTILGALGIKTQSPTPTTVSDDSYADEYGRRNLSQTPLFSHDESTVAEHEMDNPDLTAVVNGRPKWDDPEDSETGMDARLFARNPAIMAQLIEVKPYEYDLSDPTAAIKAERKKRYIAESLGISVDELNDDTAFILQEKSNGDGTVHIWLRDPYDVKVPQSVIDADKRRRAFSARDFE